MAVSPISVTQGAVATSDRVELQQRHATAEPQPLNYPPAPVAVLRERLEANGSRRKQLALRCEQPIDRMHAEQWKTLRLLLDAYYPLDHANLHVVEGEMDLRSVGACGRLDETGRLRKVVLSPPYALGGEWKQSPLAKSQGFHFDLHRALQQHAALTEYLLDNGVEVYLMLHQEGASEAVYATDGITGVGATALVGNPKHHTRQLETAAYSGGLQLAPFAGEDGPIEFGDVQLFTRDRVLYVLQGCNSWRSTEASLTGLERALEYALSKGQLGPIDRIEHIAVELSGEDTLHLDYVLNYAGTGDQRVITVCREGLAHPEQTIARMQQLLDVPDQRVIEVSREEMLAGAANLSSLSPDEVLYIDRPETRRVTERMRAAGLKVTLFPFDQMSQKDGTLHCCIGQLLRD